MWAGRRVAVDGDSAVYRAAGRWLTPELFEVRSRCPALLPLRRKMVVQRRTQRERERRRQRCPVHR
jgi:hypothetical protein